MQACKQRAVDQWMEDLLLSSWVEGSDWWFWISFLGESVRERVVKLG